MFDRIKILIILFLFCVFIINGCKGKDKPVNDESMADFSAKWKKFTAEERGAICDIFKMYDWLKGKNKEEVISLLGQPDKIDDFGDYVYNIGKGGIQGSTYNKVCTVCFDDGDKVVRIQASQ